MSQKARLDIQVYPQAVPTNAHSLLENGIARYSLVVASSNNHVFFWQSFFDQSLLNPLAIESLIRAEDHIKAPQIKRSPFSIELTPETIDDLADTVMSQVYVVISQRTYEFDASLSGKIRFFKQVILFSELVSVGNTITIQASGIINPEKFDEVPPQFQSRYPQADGSAS